MCVTSDWALDILVATGLKQTVFSPTGIYWIHTMAGINAERVTRWSIDSSTAEGEEDGPYTDREAVEPGKESGGQGEGQDRGYNGGHGGGQDRGYNGGRGAGQGGGQDGGQDGGHNGGQGGGQDGGQDGAYHSSVREGSV